MTFLYNEPGAYNETDSYNGGLTGAVQGPQGAAWDGPKPVASRLPLCVRLKTDRLDVHVTRQVRALHFRSTIPGGYASATLQLDRPLSLNPDEIATFGSLYIYDGRSGAIVWQGLLEDPGRGRSADGKVWSLQALGPSARGSDRSLPLIYVDRPQSTFTRYIADDSGDGGVDAQDGSNPGGDPAILFQIVRGVNMAVNDRTGRAYWQLRDATQKIARIAYDMDASVSDTDYQMEIVARTGSGAGDVADSVNWNTVNSHRSAVVVTNFTNGRNVVEIRTNRGANAGGAVADDKHAAVAQDIVIRAMLYNADGTEKTSGYTVDTVKASDVVADLLGRLLTTYDGVLARIDTTSYTIEQLAYVQGVEPGQVLSDMMQYETAYYWAAWEDTQNGKSRFEWRTWPTSPSYECTTMDGFDSPSSGTELYDEVVVFWTDAFGKVTSMKFSNDVPELDNAGLVRTGIIDLRDQGGATSNDATQIGNAFLADHSVQPNKGTLTIARPIMDFDRGRLVQPWEVKPGRLIRVRDVKPRADALNKTTYDAVTVFRIVSTDYDANSNTVTCDLDLPANRLETLLATPRRRRKALRLA